MFDAQIPLLDSASFPDFVDMFKILPFPISVLVILLKKMIECNPIDPPEQAKHPRQREPLTGVPG
ncbi:MAG: hypothetical protein MR033_07925 [Clostridiales bacterium]|nr:hypothetical protein [Clostridiales bacterium]